MDSLATDETQITMDRRARTRRASRDAAEMHASLKRTLEMFRRARVFREGALLNYVCQMYRLYRPESNVDGENPGLQAKPRLGTGLSPSLTIQTIFLIRRPRVSTARSSFPDHGWPQLIRMKF